MPEFALQVVDIDETGKDYTFELKKPWVEESLRDANLHADSESPPGTIEVHAQQNGTEYLLTGHVRASLTTECGRCLGIAKVPVDTQFATLFTRAATTHGHAGHHGQAASHKEGAKDKAKAKAQAQDEEELDEDDDELVREEFSGHEIVLDPLIREYLVLETPMQPLCSEDCTGIAVPKHVQPPEDVFGPTDSKVDPRLAPLLRLRDKVPPKRNNKE
jgi:uncharacterized metal-binding protein YceD (DUF177 family)